MTVRISNSLDEGRISFEVPEEQKHTAIDPVCGATVDRHDASTTSAEHRSTVYHFCSPACRERFLSDPDDFV